MKSLGVALFATTVVLLSTAVAVTQVQERWEDETAVGAAAQAATAAPEIREDNVARIVALIDEIPPWPLLGWRVSEGERELRLGEGRLIEELSSQVSLFTSDDIRRAMVRYGELIKDKRRDRDRREALFFLNKYLFDIPTLARCDSRDFATIRTGWWCSMPGATGKPSDNVPICWPWSIDEHGIWRFSVKWQVIIYSGPPYDPVNHFDRLLAVYGRRVPKGGLEEAE